MDAKNRQIVLSSSCSVKRCVEIYYPRSRIHPRVVQSIAQIIAKAEKDEISPLDVAERICDGQMPDIKPPVKRKLGQYVKIVRGLREHANAVNVVSFASPFKS